MFKCIYGSLADLLGWKSDWQLTIKLYLYEISTAEEGTVLPHALSLTQVCACTVLPAYVWESIKREDLFYAESEVSTYW